MWRFKILHTIVNAIDSVMSEDFCKGGKLLSKKRKMVVSYNNNYDTTMRIIMNKEYVGGSLISNASYTWNEGLRLDCNS